MPLSLRDYPFDEQRVWLDFESAWGRGDLRLALDDEDAALLQAPLCCLDRSVSLPDWDLERAKASIDVHEYATAFGYPKGAGDNRHFDRLRLEVVVQRELLPYLLKYLFPLLVILAMAYSRCFWGPDQLDSSVAVVTTALLAVVALHLAHATGLPEIGYLVKGDLFFLHTDLTLVSSLIALVVEHRLDAAGRSEAAQRVLKWERRLFPVVVAAGWSVVFALGAR